MRPPPPDVLLSTRRRQPPRPLFHRPDRQDAHLYIHCMHPRSTYTATRRRRAWHAHLLPTVPATVSVGHSRSHHRSQHLSFMRPSRATCFIVQTDKTHITRAVDARGEVRVADHTHVVPPDGAHDSPAVGDMPASPAPPCYTYRPRSTSRTQSLAHQPHDTPTSRAQLPAPSAQPHPYP